MDAADFIAWKEESSHLALTFDAFAAKVA